ncbi:NAD(P)-binding protein [Calocera cornea HHB12733]|uniref:NAD(P)-binding protein n=1 Tax=Calocera cornea HHB12733 TaxID=1353952 RepID=A0A165EE42_9BASI|nr:NAD(P)-binding protein [Calocera cornea HHB12733]
MGQAWAMLIQAFTEGFPPKSKFMPRDIPDLTSRVVIVTGGNTGIGKATCRYLLLKNAKVYMASRSRGKAEAAITELKQVTGNGNLHFLRLDLADLESVKACVEEFLSKENQLHLLFNNAGVMGTPMNQLTKQGFDLQFGTNVIGHAYLTMLLLPTLLETALVSPPGAVRVINDSSQVHMGASWAGINYDTLRDGPGRKKMGSMAAYNQSKWGNVVFAKELARRYGDQGIVSTSLNPGAIRTDLFRHLPSFAKHAFNWLLFDADPYGALTQLYAGTSPETASAHGKYFIPLAREGLPRADTENPEAGRHLWEYIEEFTANI